MEVWLLVGEAECAIQSVLSWKGALPTVSPKSFLMSDYTEATEGCQPAAPDPGAEVGLPSELGMRWPRTSNMPRTRLGTVFPGDLDLFSKTASPDQVTADGGRGDLNPKRASLKALQPENF